MFGRSNVLPCLSQSKFISADALLRHRGNAQLECKHTIFVIKDQNIYITIVMVG